MAEFPDLDVLSARAPERLGRELTPTERELLVLAKQLLTQPEPAKRPTPPARLMLVPRK